MKPWMMLGLGSFLLVSADVALAQWAGDSRGRQNERQERTAEREDARDKRGRDSREATVRTEARQVQRDSRNSTARQAPSQRSAPPAGYGGVATRNDQSNRGRQDFGRQDSRSQPRGQDSRNRGDRGRDDRGRDDRRGHDNGWRGEQTRNGNRGDHRGGDNDRYRGRNDHRDYRHDDRRGSRDHGNRQGWSYWRNHWQHGWSGNRYRAPARFYHPRGFSSRYWRIGLSVPLVYLASSFYVDYAYYGLAPPPYGYDWIRIDGNVLLVDRFTGEIVEILYNFYY